MKSADPSECHHLWLDAERSLDYFKGRVALYAILEAAGIGPNDEVLVPGFTCAAVPAAILYRGATPVFYDVDARSLNTNANLVLAKVTPRTRAMVVQHAFGSPAPLDELLAVAREFQLILIEDCAHALGATIGARPVGTLGDAAFCSLQWSKPVTTGLGGIARFNRADLLASAQEAYKSSYSRPSVRDRTMVGALSFLHRHLYAPRLFWSVQAGYRWLSWRGWVEGSSSRGELVDTRMPRDYRRRGWASRKTLESVLRALPSATAHRRRLAARYRERLSPHGYFSQTVPTGSQSSWLRYPTLVEERESLLDRARRERIELGDWFNAPVHPRGTGTESFGYRPGECARAEWITRRIVNLPTHPRVSEAEAERIADFVLAEALPARRPVPLEAAVDDPRADRGATP